MRFDPTRRLDRRLPGEGVEPGSRLRIHVDEARRGWEDPVPSRDKAALRAVGTRAPARLAVAGPNAPQLIRLIRTPFALATSRPSRITFFEARASAVPRPPFASALRGALADWPQVRSTPAVQPRPRPFAPRPSAAEPVPPLPAERR